MLPADFSRHLGMILEEHPSPLLLQHPQIPSLALGQLSCIPWHQCQVLLELFLRGGSKDRPSDGPKAWILHPHSQSHWTHPFLTSMCMRSWRQPPDPPD